MSDKENRSIAYIYNEMDPSEKLEFERDLNCDSNLLIEVESLKKVAGKVNVLKTIEPPAEVVEAVHQKLASTRKHSKKSSDRYIWFSAAAALLLMVGGSLYLLESEESSGFESTDSAAFGSTPALIPAPAEVADEQTEEVITPWVDHNEVIRFQDGLFVGEEAASIDSIYRQSFQKLTPVTNPAQSATARQNLHLTGNR